MMKRAHWTRSLFMLVMATAIAGCTTHETRVPVNQPYQTAKQDASVMFYPGSDASLAVVSIKKDAPSNIYAGQEFDYTIQVKNMSENMLTNVQVKEQIPGNFELISSTPAHTLSADGKSAVWNMKQLNGNETALIRVRGKATTTDAFKCCATVTYERYLCHLFNVSKPELALSKQVQREALVNELFPVRLVVSNPGTGIAKNVIVNDPLPEGLVSENGRSSLKYNIGDLSGSQSKEMSFNVKATRTGTFNNMATATADGLSAKANGVTLVTMAQLKIIKEATERQYSGRNITYTITASNEGDANAVNAMITDPLPTGATLISASDGGTLSGNQIVWKLGTLAPKARKTVTATVKANGTGTIRNTACIRADNTAQVCDSASTEVFGVSAILMEVVDSVDPLEVGGTGKYVVTVSNQGTAKDTNIKISIELEDTMSYVTSSGPTPATVRGNTVSFAPLPTLNAKTKAAWTITVKAVKSGDVRCKVQLDSDTLSRPVMETEATTIY